MCGQQLLSENSTSNGLKKKECRLCIKKYNNEYYKKNPDKLKKIENCSCGRKYKYYNKTMHLNTIYHKKYMSNTQVPDQIINIQVGQECS